MDYTRLYYEWQQALVRNMIIRDATPRQRVYILRFWETRSVPPDEPVTWRFSAQDPQTGERRGFADLDGLMAFLAAQTTERDGRQTGDRTVARIVNQVSRTPARASAGQPAISQPRADGSTGLADGQAVKSQE